MLRNLALFVHDLDLSLWKQQTHLLYPVPAVNKTIGLPAVGRCVTKPLHQLLGRRIVALDSLYTRPLRKHIGIGSAHLPSRAVIGQARMIGGLFRNAVISVVSRTAPSSGQPFHPFLRSLL